MKKGYGKKGWAFIIYCILAFYVTTAFKDTMNVAVLNFEQNYGWDRTLLFSLASIGAYVTCAVTYILGILNASGKVKARHIALITGLIYAVTIGLWGKISDLNMFIVNYIIMTIGYTTWAQFANNTILANWFPKKSGAVMGIVTIGFPLAAATNSLLFQKLSQSLSFENIYILFGILTLAVCLYGFFSFKDNPEESGFYPDNDETMTIESLEELKRREAEVAKNSPWTPKRMLMIKETWFIGISSGLILLISSGSMGQMVVRFMTGGIPIQTAVKLMTLVGGSAIVGSWLIGVFDYKFGVKKAYMGTILLLIIACLLYSIDNFYTMALGAMIIGIGLGGATNFIVSMASHYWGRHNFKKAYGTLFTVTTLIGSAGAILVANLAATTGYRTAYLLLAGLNVAAFILASLIKEGFVARYEAKFAEEDSQGKIQVNLVKESK